ALTLACGTGNGGPTNAQLTATALSTLLGGDGTVAVDQIDGTPPTNGVPADGTPVAGETPATPGDGGETAATATTAAPAGGAAETATRRILEVTETAAARAAATGTAEAGL